MVAWFASRLESEVLAPVPHRRYVFTIPKLLRLNFRFDRRLLGLLSHCAYRSVLEMMRAVVSEPGAVPGMVASIQTYGYDQAANWHPHVHALVTDGIFLADGTFRSLPPPDYQQLLLLFRHKLIKQLFKLDKITEAAVEILDRFRHPGFSAFQGQPVEPNDITGREKLAVYILHPPVALGRIDYQPGAGAAFHPVHGGASDRDDPVRLDPFESLAALTDHIPDRGQHLVRFYGWYSNKNRGLRKKRTSPDGAGSIDSSSGSDTFSPSDRAPADSPDDDFRNECKRTWARMIKNTKRTPWCAPDAAFPCACFR